MSASRARKVETKAARIRRHVLELLDQHASQPDGLPTNIRFLFYELEHRGHARKPDPNDKRKNRRREHGWPPGIQDVTDAVTALRNEGEIPWDWITDEDRHVMVWPFADSAAEYLSDRLAGFSLNPWGAEPPLILTETNGMAAVLKRVAGEFVCPIAGTKGQTAGFLRTVIAPLIDDNERRVLYLGDRDRSGEDIEQNTRRVLERVVGREIDWTRIGLTEAQTEGIEPIWKVDGRDKQGRWAWECESLGQSVIVALVRAALHDLLPEPLDAVLEREDVEREAMRVYLEKYRGPTP